MPEYEVYRQRRNERLASLHMPQDDVRTAYFYHNFMNDLQLDGIEFEIGGGFSADGYLVVSDQTFLRLFKRRVPGAPSMIFVKVEPGVPAAAVVDRLRAALPASDTTVRTVAEAVASDQRFQTTQKPIGIVFGSNLGTTATGWIVATLGFKVELQAFALPLVAVGGFLGAVGADLGQDLAQHLGDASHAVVW